jgi:hypothetical protein
MLRQLSPVLLAATAAFLAAQPAAAQFIRTDAGFAANVTPRNDDWSFPGLDAGFDMRVGGSSTATVGVSNNGYAWVSTSDGNVTFGVFVADLDTRNWATSPVTYGTSMVGGRQAFGVNWLNVGYYSNGGPAVNAQLVLIDRSDVALGDFDVEYNYGDMSGATYGSVYTQGPVNSWTAPGSGDWGTAPALMDRRYAVEARNGILSNGVNVAAPLVTPEPGTWALLGTGLVGVVGVARRKRTA